MEPPWLAFFVGILISLSFQLVGDQSLISYGVVRH